jgi:hypothetical protein
MQLHIGVVEDRRDPLRLGRCRVRVMGIMTDNKSELPTEDLPWATPIQPITSAAISGIGHSPVGPVEGSWVTIVFLDQAMQYPMMTGTIAGIPGLTTNISDVEKFDEDEYEETSPSAPIVTTGSGGTLTDSSGAPVTSTNFEDTVIGPLTADEYSKLKEAIAKKESGGRYDIVEKKHGNHLGKYQVGSMMLFDNGYLNAAMPKNVVQNPAYWTGKDGISSKEDFLNSPKVQESLYDMYMQKNAKMLKLTKDTPKENAAGALAMCQLGIGAAKKALNGQSSADANGTSSEVWWKLGASVITKKTTATSPDSQPLDKPQIDKDEPEKEGNKKFDVPVSKANRDAAPKQGFTDPNGKYPLKSQLKEPDTSRLARSSKLKDTIVGTKEATRITGIPVANGGSWSQPPIPYAAKYPFNHVYESESGHVMEFDDTPGAERVNIHHKSGTFNETDAFGNQTERIVGAKIVIVEKDELVYIKGSGHISVEGDISILAEGSCQIQVGGNANISVNGSVYQSVAGDFNLKAGGNINLDGADIFLNSGASQGVQVYSPTIEQIYPPTRQEMNDIMTEETDKPALKDTPPVEKKAEDTTPTLKVIPVAGECGFTDIGPSTLLTPNYTINKLCVGSSTGQFPFGKGQHNIKDVELACNLKQLAMNVIEPIKEKYGHLGFIITSCFRHAGNGVSKSSRISQHELGQAVDIQFTSFNRNRQKYFEFAQELKNSVPFDQFLLEYRSPSSVWYHLSFKSSGNRSQILTLNEDKTVGQGLILVA